MFTVPDPSVIGNASTLMPIEPKNNVLQSKREIKCGVCEQRRLCEK